MKLIYIYHSCFVIETDKFSVLIDFFKDTESSNKGYVHDVVLKENKKLYVLSSHVHPDHFNPVILSWKKQNNEIQYILSRDILTDGKAQENEAVFLDKNEAYNDENIQIKAYGSTDIGISFVIEINGKVLFHAGDLNNWHWKDESTPEEIKESEQFFLKELADLSADYKEMDVVMFPVDPRLGTDYMAGAEQFITEIKTRLFVPMHFGHNYEKAALFKPYAELKETCFLEPAHKGQIFMI